MSSDITPVSLFTLKSAQAFFGKTGGDYDRGAITALACAFMVIGKYSTSPAGRSFSSVAGPMLTVCAWWEIGDTFSALDKVGSSLSAYAQKQCSPLRKGVEWWNGKKDENLKSVEGYQVAKDVFLYSLKAFANGMDVLRDLASVGALKCPDLRVYLLLGALSGAIFFAHSLYDTLTKEPEEPEKINLVKQEAQKTYRLQHEWKTRFGTAITTSVLAMKILSAFGGYYGLYGGGGMIKWVAHHKDDIFLSIFSVFTVSCVGSHLREEQMKAFRKLNKAS